MPFLGSGPDVAAPGSGYLSRADYIEILKAAKARQIEVIPSFDMPGHSRAAILAMKARARRLIAAGKPEEAARYRLDEPDDSTTAPAVLHGPCLQLVELARTLGPEAVDRARERSGDSS